MTTKLTRDNNHDLAVWPVSGLARIFPVDRPPRNPGAGWNLAGARGEYITFQLGVAANMSLCDLSVVVAQPVGRPRAVPSSWIRVRWVSLIPVGYDYFHAQGAERPELFPAWYPDPLTDAPPWNGIKPPPPRAAAVHLTLHIPRDAAAGAYRGAVNLLYRKQVRVRIPLILQVWPFAIPRRPTFYVTNWLQNDCIGKWHRCEAWSPRFWRILEQYAREMAAHRQNVITTPTIIGNFHNSDPMTLVDIVHRRNGGFRFDLRRLEQWVRLFDRYGFALFEMWHLAEQGYGRYAPPFGFYDERTKRQIRYDKLSVNSVLYRELVGGFLEELSVWLERRGWLDRFLLHVFDEPIKDRWPHYTKLAAFFRKHAPRLRHLDAISQSELITGYASELDIPVPLTPHLDDADGYYRQRARDGCLPVWWYTCCAPTALYANRFIGQPLITTRILHWQAFACDISGYLHWGYNFWHRPGQDVSGWPGITPYADHLLVNPYREQPRWPAGDTHIVYPDPQWWLDKAPVSSLRYEAMREGLQDYELMRMLERALQDRHGRARRNHIRTRGRHLLRLVRGPLAGSLTKFTRNAGLLLRTRRAIGDCLAELA